MTVTAGIQLAIVFILPYLIIKIGESSGATKLISPIIWCYAIGMLLGNLLFIPINDAVNDNVTQITILLALPLLLVTTNIKAWLKTAGQSLMAFGIALIAIFISSLVSAWLFVDLPLKAESAAMLAGVYTGGTPNMASINTALNAPKQLFVLLNVTDLVFSFLYLVFLTSVSLKVLAVFLPNDEFNVDTKGELKKPEVAFSFQSILKSLAVAIIIVAVSLLSVWLLFGQMRLVWIILFLTSLSIVASFKASIRNLPFSYPMGDYLLLVFSVAAGLMADFTELANASITVFLFNGFLFLLNLFIFYLLCYLFKINATVSVISSTAMVFGPAFIGQVATAIKRPDMVFTGISIGIMGYAIGNYLGILIATIVKLFGV